jgi:hypothetical protein
VRTGEKKSGRKLTQHNQKRHIAKAPMELSGVITWGGEGSKAFNRRFPFRSKDASPH